MDVVASSGWLHPALAAMEMCQMVTQGQWEKDSPLLQLPHITPQVAAAAAAKDISTVFDLIEMEDEDRRELLQVGLNWHGLFRKGYAACLLVWELSFTEHPAGFRLFTHEWHAHQARNTCVVPHSLPCCSCQAVRPVRLAGVLAEHDHVCVYVSVGVCVGCCCS